jgi:transposase-like protein
MPRWPNCWPSAADASTVYDWVRGFAPRYEAAARSFCRAVGERWIVDETYVKVADDWAYVSRAIDEHGEVADVYVSAQRATEDAATFFRRAIRVAGLVPAAALTMALYTAGGLVAGAAYRALPG